MRSLLIICVAFLMRVNSQTVPSQIFNTEATTTNGGSVTETTPIIITTVSPNAGLKLENTSPFNSVGALNQSLNAENSSTGIDKVSILGPPTDFDERSFVS